MAKTKKVGGTNLIEQHVEKAVLGVSVLVAVFFLVNWVFSSPRKIEIAELRGAAKPLAPGDVDKRLAEMAQELEDHMTTAAPKPWTAPNILADIQSAVNRPDNDQVLKDYVAFTSGRTPMTAEKMPGSQKADLAQITAALPPPEMPLVKMNREELIGANATPDPKNPESQLKEVVVANVACVYDHAAPMKKWMELTDKTLIRPQFTVVAVEAQRRQRKPDGSWGEPETVSMARLRTEAPAPALPSFNEQNTEEIRTALQQLASQAIQKQVVEPDYYNIIWPNRMVGTWMIKDHKPRTRVSDLLGVASSQPAQGQALSAVLQSGQNPATPNAPTPAVPAGGGSGNMRRSRLRDMGGGDLGGDESPTPRAPERTGGAGGAPPREAPRTPPHPTGGGGIGSGGGGGGRLGSGGGGRLGSGGGAPAVRPTTPTPAAGTPAKPTDEEKVELVLVPDMASQINGQLLEAWFHDESLQDGVTYYYRVRLVLANPLFGYKQDVAREADAKAVTINTPWSEWSEPVSAHRPTEFFFVSASPDKQEANVMVYAQKWGQRIKRQFTVKPGEMIGQEMTVPVVGLDGKTQSAAVDFRTGVLFLDADWDKQVRLRSMMAKTAELVCQDGDGHLFTRMDARDRMSDRVTKLNKECQPPPAATPGATPSVTLGPTH